MVRRGPSDESLGYSRAPFQGATANAGVGARGDFAAKTSIRACNRTPSASAGPSPEARRTQDWSLALPVLLEALNQAMTVPPAGE